MTPLYPCYMRMAMGGTHAVHILMSINTAEIGKCFQAARVLSSVSSGDVALDLSAEQTSLAREWSTERVQLDSHWKRTQPAKAQPSDLHRVHNWADHVREQRRLWENAPTRNEPDHWRRRPWVIVHFFSGLRREADFGAWARVF